MKEKSPGTSNSNVAYLTDEELAEALQNENIEAFEELVSRYKDRIVRYAQKFVGGLDVDDVVQTTLLKTYRNIQSFDTKRKFSSWIYRIAHNEALNFIKKEKREPVPFFDPDTIFPHPIDEKDPESDFEREEMKEKISESLEKLPPKYREPIVLYYFENQSYRAISEIMKIPQGTVAIRLKRALEKLKTIHNHE